MANLDVSDILFDPDFADTNIFCERSVQTINDNGLAVNETRRIRFTGVVTPDTGDLLERMDALCSFAELFLGTAHVHNQLAVCFAHARKTIAGS